MPITTGFAFAAGSSVTDRAADETGLAAGGLLWLGEVEWPSPRALAWLEPVNARARLFRRREGEVLA